MRATILNKENVQLLLGSLVALLFFIFGSQSSYAAIKPIACETNFGEKSFVIESQTIAFKKHNDEGRSISSVLNSQTKKSHMGFKKTLYVNGHKYFISIKNEKRFNNVDDFLAITTPKGHKMTYPINCHLLD